MFDSKVSTAALIKFTRVSSAVCLSSEVVKGLRVDDCGCLFGYVLLLEAWIEFGSLLKFEALSKTPL